IEWTCSLPPRCSSEPRTFHTLDEFESHYHLEHAHHCTILTDEIDGQQAERGGRGILCGKIFPSDHLLQCHIDEVQRHPYCACGLVAAPSEALRCLDSDCNVLSGSEDERREHAIKAHAFPRGYYFDVVQEGIGSLLHQHGPGASLLVSVAAEAGPAKRPAIGMETQADQASSSTWACEENAFVRHKRTRSSSDADEVRERTPGILQGSLPSLPSPSLHSPSVPSANAFSNLVDELGSLSLIPNVLTRRQKRIVA
ncbi:hypothetical protein V8E36_002048, partial [Tilletia maclaganii]